MGESGHHPGVKGQSAANNRESLKHTHSIHTLALSHTHRRWEYITADCLKRGNGSFSGSFPSPFTLKNKQTNQKQTSKQKEKAFLQVLLKDPLQECVVA